MIIAMIVAIPPSIIAAASFVSSLRNNSQIKDLHIEVNDRLSQLIKKSEALAHAQGVQKERVEQAARETLKKENGG